MIGWSAAVARGSVQRHNPGVRGATPSPVRRYAGLWQWLCRHRWLRSRYVLALLALGLGYQGLVVMTHEVHWLSLLPVRQIEQPRQLLYQDAAAVSQAVAALQGQSLLLVDLRPFKQAVEALPWVASASLSRQWPDRVVLDIIEQQPVAYWNDQLVLNERFEVLPAIDSALTLPALYGPQGSADQVAWVYLQFKSLLAQQQQQIAQLHLWPDGAWQIDTQAQVQVLLGSQDRLQRLRRVMAFYRAAGEKASQIRRIDARYDNGVAVKWQAAPANLNEHSALERTAIEVAEAYSS